MGVSDQEGNFKLINPAPNVDPSTEGLTTELVISKVGYETEVTTIGHIVQKNHTGTPETHNITLKEKVIYIDLRRYAEADQHSHQTSQPHTGSSGERIFHVVEAMPEYPGGFYELGQYITENQKRAVRDMHLSGIATIGFTIDTEGRVTDVKILESDSDLTGNEAAKIVLNMPEWKPGTQGGVTVPVKFAVPIVF